MIGNVSQNSLISYLENGYSLEENFYSPATLALVEKRDGVVDDNVCGNGIVDL